ncbi:Rad21/Rec8-like protein, partial [Jimgerdemannia flammicorona]
MFYSKEILTRKKGGFGVIWLAATLGSKSNLKKLTKKEVNGVDVSRLVISRPIRTLLTDVLSMLHSEYLTHPPEPLALRLTSNLMVGVARVYNQQYQFYYSNVSIAFSPSYH